MKIKMNREEAMKLYQDLGSFLGTNQKKFEYKLSGKPVEKKYKLRKPRDVPHRYITDEEMGELNHCVEMIRKLLSIQMTDRISDIIQIDVTREITNCLNEMEIPENHSYAAVCKLVAGFLQKNTDYIRSVEPIVNRNDSQVTVIFQIKVEPEVKFVGTETES